MYQPTVLALPDDLIKDFAPRHTSSLKKDIKNSGVYQIASAFEDEDTACLLGSTIQISKGALRTLQAHSVLAQVLFSIPTTF